MPLGGTNYDLHAVTGSNGLIYVFGGLSNLPIPNTLSNALQIYNPATNTWTGGASIATPVAGFTVGEGTDGRIYVMGGYDNNSFSPSNLVQVYNPTTNS